MATEADLKWKGYAIHDTKNWDKFEVIDFKPKTAWLYDIDIKIEFCGVCGSDVHTITGGWGQPILPLIPGHEIIGKVVKVGPKVTTFSVGDRVGVGARICACFYCERCNCNNENHCLQVVDTYNSKYPSGDIAYAGYSTAVRAHERFVFPIPPELSSEVAAPMLCAGITVYSPLVRNGAGYGKSIGVVGIGGLGHLALQFARALDVSRAVAFTHSAKKEDDARKLGATDVVLTGKKGFVEPWKGKLDLIICTADVSHGIPLNELLTTLQVNGRFIMVAVPNDKLPDLHAFDLISNGVHIGGSAIGSKKEIIEMMGVAARKGVRSWVQLLDMKQASLAVNNVKNNTVKYRHVLKADL